MSKALVARALAKRVKDGDVLGLGSGSTAELAIEQIGQRIAKERLNVFGIATSYRTALVAQRAGLRILSSLSDAQVTWAFDGADEVDPAFNMIKGRGAAMLSEKIMAHRAGDNFVIIVSDDKLVEQLGKKFPIPVEVIPEAIHLVEKGLLALGAREILVRESSAKYGPTISEHNHLVLDAWFDQIEPSLESRLKSLVGVVETGLFVGTTKELLIARDTGVYSRTIQNGKIEEALVEAP